jgi:hypothetical protein
MVTFDPAVPLAAEARGVLETPFRITMLLKSSSFVPGVTTVEDAIIAAAGISEATKKVESIMKKDR